MCIALLFFELIVTVTLKVYNQFDQGESMKLINKIPAAEFHPRVRIILPLKRV